MTYFRKDIFSCSDVPSPGISKDPEPKTPQTSSLSTTLIAKNHTWVEEERGEMGDGCGEESKALGGRTDRGREEWRGREGRGAREANESPSLQ